MTAWTHRALAFLGAWAIIHAGLAALDWIADTGIEPIVIGWICVGVSVRLLRQSAGPWRELPRADRVDVRGAHRAFQYELQHFAPALSHLHRHDISRSHPKLLREPVRHEQAGHGSERFATIDVDHAL